MSGPFIPLKGLEEKIMKLHYSTSRKLIVKNGVFGRENYILIQDEGPGIPREFHDFLFQPFQRDKGARQLNPEGCGLGLLNQNVIFSAKHAIFYDEFT